MSKMNTISVNSFLSNETPTKKAIARIKVANKLIELLEDHESHSIRELEQFFLDNMADVYYGSTSVKSILEWFELSGLVKSDIRAEEFIEKEDWVRVYYDKNGNEVPSHIEATLKDGTVFETSNSHIHSTRREKRNIKIQVKRRYYTWIA